MLTLLDALDLTLIIVVPSAIVLGIIIFFLTGIYHVKKNQVFIIEKMDQFYEVAKEGWHYYLPLKYRRKAIIPINEKTLAIHIKNGRDLLLTFQVIDPQKFYYSHIDIENYINVINDENEVMSEEVLKDSLLKVGIKYISIKAKN